MPGCRSKSPPQVSIIVGRRGFERIDIAAASPVEMPADVFQATRMGYNLSWIPVENSRTIHPFPYL
jgi:hypothetical protein